MAPSPQNETTEPLGHCAPIPCQGRQADVGPGGTADLAQVNPEESKRLREEAEEFKKKGNALLKEGTRAAFLEAIDLYTRGIEVRCLDPVVNCQLFSNRAHVRISVRQFVEAVDDCRKAIGLDPSNLKSYWRAAKASMNLQLYKNAAQFCEDGLALDPESVDLKRMKETCDTRLQQQVDRRAKKEAFSPEEAMELQEKMQEVEQQLGTLSQQMQLTQREAIRNKLTVDALNEVADVTPPPRVFRSCGRAFLLTESEVVKEELLVKMGQYQNEMPKLSATKVELEKRRTEIEKSLREMIGVFKRGN